MLKPLTVQQETLREIVGVIIVASILTLIAIFFTSGNNSKYKYCTYRITTEQKHIEIVDAIFFSYGTRFDGPSAHTTDDTYIQYPRYSKVELLSCINK